MDDQGISQAREVLHKLKLFWCLDDSEITLTRLGGLTNLVFRADHGGEQYVLRIPGKGTEEYINRANEAQAAREAAKAGVSPDVVHFDPITGVMVTRLVDDAVTMSPGNFKSIAGSPARAGHAFRKLHQSGARFDFRFELFPMIDGYLKILADKSAELPSGYHAAVRDAEAVRAALNAHPLPSAACHCDPLCENLLDTGKRMWIVDWEYSGMNDPMWDLGDLSVEGEFTKAQEEEMIRAYFGGEASPAERGRIVIYKAMCDLLWTLWGLIQNANKNPADDFWAYSLNRFQRCRALMATPDFQRHVASVAKGALP
jgi:thiamine kinase-like enzyme